MARKSTFPVVPVLLIAGGALVAYALTRKKEIKTIPKAPGVPPSGIVVPGTPGNPQGQAFTRSRSPYIIQQPAPLPPPLVPPPEFGDQPISVPETILEPNYQGTSYPDTLCPTNRQFIPTTDPRYNPNLSIHYNPVTNQFGNCV